VNQDLESLTIVILSRERQQVLLKTMDYWHKCGVKTLVLDNSSEPILETSIPSSSNYIYCKGVSFPERAARAANFLSSTFAILSSDDEQYLPSALKEMISEMNSDPNIASIGGLAIGVDKYGPRVTGSRAYFSMRNYENVNTNNSTRMKFHFSNEYDRNRIAALYRLFYSKELCKILKIFGECTNISTPYIYEVTAEIVATALGGTKYLDTIYWIRNWRIPPIQKNDWNRRLLFFQWWDSSEFEQEKQYWIELLLLSIAEDLNRSELVNFINHFALVGRNSNSSLQTSITKILRFPNSLKYCLRKIFKSSSLPKRIEDVISEIKAEGIHANLSEIKNVLSNFYY